MKRDDFLRYLQERDCYLHRQGDKHEIWINSTNRRKSSIPRHSEIQGFLVKKICEQLDIPPP